ncbi:hypothetical protein PMAYCL1PPCAC_29420 [Pristionchus mayeri]|uniref:Uncharacterized protein n=1 Tax=Pristionchus mayeri TaxID=1317129 RepID=A0AAN5DAU2_9BILA|nr:hypothetical protein PMAYCL1PPCAC_29420 [Pristionchus mayeri]
MTRQSPQPSLPSPSSASVHTPLRPVSIDVSLDGSSTPLSPPDMPSLSSSSPISIIDPSIGTRRGMPRSSSMGFFRRLLGCFWGDPSEDEHFPSSSYQNGENGEEAPIHKIVEFTHELVPNMDRILAAPYYWGPIDRHKAEELLEDQPEGTFLLRDSAQPEYVFSVSFRRYKRTLHARIEQANGSFGFDILDQSVFRAPTIIKLIENYKDPIRCMFFEPQLSSPLRRERVFTLQELARSVLTSRLRYKDIAALPLPKNMLHFISEYHYSVPVRTIRPQPTPSPPRVRHA